jgi:hypothetical protein
MPDGGFIHDIGAMGVIDWFRLGGLLVTMAITYAIGMEAGYAKAARNGGVGWLGFAFLSFLVALFEIASHAGAPAND